MSGAICVVEKFDGDVFGLFRPPLSEHAITDAIAQIALPSEYVGYTVGTRPDGAQEVVVSTSHLPNGRDAQVREGIRLALSAAYTTNGLTNS